MHRKYLKNKKCDRCDKPVEEYYSIQTYQGEAWREAIAIEDSRLCAECHEKLGKFLHTKYI